MAVLTFVTSFGAQLLTLMQSAPRSGSYKLWPQFRDIVATWKSASAS